jgi:hypothetical protein
MRPDLRLGTLYQKACVLMHVKIKNREIIPEYRIQISGPSYPLFSPT